jgi:hypothetical protein
MKKPVPISDEEAYDSSCWTHKHDDLVKHIIDQIGHPDQSGRNCARTGDADWPLRASLLERAGREIARGESLVLRH